MRHVIPPPAVASVPVAGGGAFPVRRIYCVGRNYAEHAQEMGFSGREPPFFFMKPADAVLPVAEGETGVMDYPPLTGNLHHEIELVVAIGKGGSGIGVADAPAHIWGYAVGLDMTRRDLQGEAKKQGRPWCIAKGFDQVVTVPRVEEQRKIAAFVDRQSQRFDLLVQEAHAAVDLLQERRASLISAAVTGKIAVRGLVASEDAA